MKSSIVALPIVIQAALVAVLYLAATSTPAPNHVTSHPGSDIHQLRQQRDEIEVRLNDLEGRTRVFLPRGMGSSPAVTAKEISPSPPGAELSAE